MAELLSIHVNFMCKLLQYSQSKCILLFWALTARTQLQHSMLMNISIYIFYILLHNLYERIETSFWFCLVSMLKIYSYSLCLSWIFPQRRSNFVKRIVFEWQNRKMLRKRVEIHTISFIYFMEEKLIDSDVNGTKSHFKMDDNMTASCLLYIYCVMAWILYKMYVKRCSLLFFLLFLWYICVVSSKQYSLALSSYYSFFSVAKENLQLEYVHTNTIETKNAKKKN